MTPHQTVKAQARETLLTRVLALEDAIREPTQYTQQAFRLLEADVLAALARLALCDDGRVRG